MESVPTFVLMQVGQVLLVREDDGLVLSDNLATEALPAGGQLPQLLQFTHSASKTEASAPGSALPENKVHTEASRCQGGPSTGV